MITWKSHLKQDNVVWGDGKRIRLQNKIPFVTSLIISRWLKKYYYIIPNIILLWSEFSKYKIENYSLIFDTTQLCIISCENLK